MGNTKVTYREYLREKIDAVQGIKKKKRALNEKMDEIMEQLNKIEDERNNLRKNVPRNLNTPAAIQEQIEALQKKYETSTLKKEEEKNTMKEIKFLKNSISSAQRLAEIKPRADELFEQRKGIREQINHLKADIQGKEVEIEEIRKKQEEAQAQRTDLKEKLDAFEQDIQKIKAEMNDVIEKKKEEKEQYYKEKLEFEIEQDQIRHGEYIAKAKQRLQDKAEEKKKRLEERKQEAAERVNPYEREIEICDHIIAYLNRKKIEGGLVQNEST